jgi:uncharacterized iron-regulated membrane protein
MGPLPQWLNFLVMFLAILLAAAGALIWLVVFRKKGKRKRRKHRHHEERQLNPTLAETGGLPPVREEKRPDEPTPPP